MFGMIAEMAIAAHRVALFVNESFVMVAAHDRYGLGILDWHPDLERGSLGFLRVDYPSDPLADPTGWLAAVADRLVPVVDQACAAVAADRAGTEAGR